MTKKWLDEVYGKTNSELYDNWVNYNEQVIEAYLGTGLKNKQKSVVQ